VIDDDLMDEALEATGLKTRKEAVAPGLRTLIRLKTGRHQALGLNAHPQERLTPQLGIL
jgi:Arc/MetJ family transcription regulator